MGAPRIRTLVSGREALMSRAANPEKRRRALCCAAPILLTFFLSGRCVSADAAAVFAALDNFGLLSTFDAAVPAFASVFSFFKKKGSGSFLPTEKMDPDRFHGTAIIQQSAFVLLYGMAERIDFPLIPLTRHIVRHRVPRRSQ